MSDSTHRSSQWVCIPEAEGDEMKVCCTSISISSPVPKHELGVIPTFKDAHFSYGMAYKHQPPALSGAQPKEQRSRLVWAVLGVCLELLQNFSRHCWWPALYPNPATASHLLCLPKGITQKGGGLMSWGWGGTRGQEIRVPTPNV